MPSTFTWLDYSEHERRKMLDVIELFGERTTRDELGLGGVRDAFADLFFPGTSTIQTRAKYFLFVPWVYMLLEEKRASSGIVAQRARKLETDLMLAIEQSGDSNGLIGRRAKENVQRLASSVYWLGTLTWGLRVFPGSQDEYHRSLDLYYTRRQGRKASSHEFEGESHHAPDLINWHAGIPKLPQDFPQDATFELTKAEAAYLRERVLTNCPRSLLAHVLRERTLIGDVPNCWDLDATVPPTLREQLNHGRNFSEVMLGAQLLYNLMLAELRPWPEKEQSYQEELSAWWELVEARRSELTAWDRPRFWQIVRTENPRISHRAQSFVDQWISLALSSTKLAEITTGAAARNVIDHRETQLKHGQSRLHNRRALELWNGAAGAGQMDLRWTAARRIATDILVGLGAA